MPIIIVTDCAGCGCALKEYDELLEGQASTSGSADFRAKVRDISEFLAEVGSVPKDSNRCLSPSPTMNTVIWFMVKAFPVRPARSSDRSPGSNSGK